MCCCIWLFICLCYRWTAQCVKTCVYLQRASHIYPTISSPPCPSVTKNPDWSYLENEKSYYCRFAGGKTTGFSRTFQIFKTIELILMGWGEGVIYGDIVCGGATFVFGYFVAGSGEGATQPDNTSDHFPLCHCPLLPHHCYWGGDHQKNCFGFWKTKNKAILGRRPKITSMLKGTILLSPSLRNKLGAFDNPSKTTIFWQILSWR